MLKILALETVEIRSLCGDAEEQRASLCVWLHWSLKFLFRNSNLAFVFSLDRVSVASSVRESELRRHTEKYQSQCFLPLLPRDPFKLNGSKLDRIELFQFQVPFCATRSNTRRTRCPAPPLNWPEFIVPWVNRWMDHWINARVSNGFFIKNICSFDSIGLKACRSPPVPLFSSLTSSEKNRSQKLDSFFLR